MTSIYDLKLHQATFIDDTDPPQGRTIVTRVPGGWLYSIPAPDARRRHVFVPYSDEFKNIK